MGTPWHHQAYVKGVGCDCIGLGAGVALAVGVREAAEWLRDTAFRGYGRDPSPLLRQACSKYLDPIKIGELDRGDLALFAVTGSNTAPWHFGLVSALNPTTIIHANLARRKVVENSLPMANATIVGAYRFRGVE